MFEHSIKVPRQYKIAANIYKKVATEGGSVKTLLYDVKLRHFRIDVLYALITETIKHAAIIDQVLEHSKLLLNEPRFDPWLAKVLTTELLFGKKSLPGQSKPERTILSYKELFEKYASEHEGDMKIEDLLTASFKKITMAETDGSPLVPEHAKRTMTVLAYLFLHSIAMFTLPFVAFFGVRHMLTEYYPVSSFAVNSWSVIAAVVVVYIIIFIYAYRAYHEKEYDDDGNEIDQHAYPTLPAAESSRSSLNMKED